jgi:tetratricopeptide (TPR) repeat protein
MQEIGGQPLDIERTVLEPGDVVIAPWMSGPFIPLPRGTFEVAEVAIRSRSSWFNVFGNNGTEAAGFYSADWGPVPFAIGRLPRQEFFVMNICCRVQFNARPVPQAASQAGEVPVFTDNACTAYGSLLAPGRSDPVIEIQRTRISFPAPAEAIRELELADQRRASGNMADAIALNLKVLEVDPDNVLALNNVASLLCAAKQNNPEINEQALHFASRAVELTHGRLPIFLTTQAAAYANVGRFSDAVMTAERAKQVARAAGMPEMASRNAELQQLYAQGRTAKQ